MRLIELQNRPPHTPGNPPVGVRYHYLSFAQAWRRANYDSGAPMVRTSLYAAH
jgi:hypothetical protein